MTLYLLSYFNSDKGFSAFFSFVFINMFLHIGNVFVKFSPHYRRLSGVKILVFLEHYAFGLSPLLMRKASGVGSRPRKLRNISAASIDPPGCNIHLL